MIQPSSTAPITPALGTGSLMAAYLLLRPYGDSEPGIEMARAFASSGWVIAHLCGAFAIASFAWLALRIDDVYRSAATRLARFTGLAGAVLVLPYFGAETFGLHAVGQRALSDPTALELVDQIRTQPAALTTFGIGLILLATSGIALAISWRREHRGTPQEWAATPLGVALALLLPQFYLPPTGRRIFGVLTLLAAAWLVLKLSQMAGGPAGHVRERDRMGGGA